MQGIVKRLRKHKAECFVNKVNSNSDVDADSAEAGASTSTNNNQAQRMNTASNSKTQTDELLLLIEYNGTEDNSRAKWKQEFDSGARNRRTRPSMGSVYIAKDSDVTAYKKKTDTTWNVFFATNTPFSHIEHAQFVKLCSTLQ